MKESGFDGISIVYFDFCRFCCGYTSDSKDVQMVNMLERALEYYKTRGVKLLSAN